LGEKLHKPKVAPEFFYIFSVAHAGDFDDEARSCEGVDALSGEAILTIAEANRSP
jgi:hypothetical protein